MIIVIESIILCILFTLMVLVMSKNPIKTLYNYPPQIQEKVKSLKEYKNQIPTTKNMLGAKLFVSLLIIVIISLILKYINGWYGFRRILLHQKRLHGKQASQKSLSRPTARAQCSSISSINIP